MKTDKEIEAEVLQAAHEIFDLDKRKKYHPHLQFFPGRCSECGERHSQCLPILVTGETLCPHCWIKRRIAERKKEELEKNRPKLDLKDFARI